MVRACDKICSAVKLMLRMAFGKSGDETRCEIETYNGLSSTGADGLGCVWLETMLVQRKQSSCRVMRLNLGAYFRPGLPVSCLHVSETMPAGNMLCHLRCSELVTPLDR